LKPCPKPPAGARERASTGTECRRSPVAGKTPGIDDAGQGLAMADFGLAGRFPASVFAVSARQLSLTLQEKVASDFGKGERFRQNLSPKKKN